MENKTIFDSIEEDITIFIKQEIVLYKKSTNQPISESIIFNLCLLELSRIDTDYGTKQLRLLLSGNNQNQYTAKRLQIFLIYLRQKYGHGVIDRLEKDGIKAMSMIYNINIKKLNDLNNELKSVWLLPLFNRVYAAI